MSIGRETLREWRLPAHVPPALRHGGLTLGIDELQLIRDTPADGR